LKIEKKIKNFPKNPANGGIPAKDKKIKLIINSRIESEELRLEKSNNLLNSTKLYRLTLTNIKKISEIENK
jgi:hypothetical protein